MATPQQLQIPSSSIPGLEPALWLLFFLRAHVFLLRIRPQPSSTRTTAPRVIGLLRDRLREPQDGHSEWNRSSPEGAYATNQPTNQLIDIFHEVAAIRGIDLDDKQEEEEMFEAQFNSEGKKMLRRRRSRLSRRGITKNDI